MPRHKLVLVGKVEVDHISNNCVKFMKEHADTDYDPTSPPRPTSSIENPSSFYTHTFGDGPATAAAMVWDVCEW
jgi:hypothetical protein